MKTNLVTLSKFERTDIVEPTEQHTLCIEHYEQERRKENYRGFEVVGHLSSMPKTWCETCTPAEYRY